MKNKNKFVIIGIFIILSFLSFRFLLNQISIILYNNKIYNELISKSLYIFNINQPYIAYYNNANIYFNKEKYNLAIKNYKLALKRNPPKSKICNIRINLSLATISNISSNKDTKIIEQLELAKNYLYENNCAHKLDNNGYSKDAEKLKKEINELENKIKNNNYDNDNTNNEEQNNNNKDYETIEQKILQNEKTANSNRQNELNNDNNMGIKEYYDGKIW